MRRFTILGLLVLFTTCVYTDVSAGQFEACEASKQLFQELGVYGLCNAWHNADSDEEREKFADKFEDKAGFEPPWLIGPACPCFSLTALAYAGTQVPSSCVDGSGLKIAKYNPGVVNLEYYASSAFCFFRNNTGDGPEGVPPMVGLTVDQVQACLDAISGLIDLDFVPNEIACGN